MESINDKIQEKVRKKLLPYIGWCLVMMLIGGLTGSDSITKKAMIGLLVLGVVGSVYGLYSYFTLLWKTQKAAESDDVEVRREALYQLGNQEWDWAHGDNPKMTHADRDRHKNKAVEYWLQAERLGHEGAADNLLMAQIRR